jgi:hypothetical protein
MSLLLDANMLDANISVGQRVVSGPDSHERAGLEKEISELPRGKREKAADPSPLPAWPT